MSNGEDLSYLMEKHKRNLKKVLLYWLLENLSTILLPSLSLFFFFVVTFDHSRATVSIQNSSSSQEVLQALASKDLILAKFIQLLSQGIAASWVYVDSGKSNNKELFVFEFGNARIQNKIEVFHGLKDILSIFIYFVFLTLHTNFKRNLEMQ